MIEEMFNLPTPWERTHISIRQQAGTVSYMKHQIFCTVAYISMLWTLMPANITNKMNEILGNEIVDIMMKSW